MPAGRHSSILTGTHWPRLQALINGDWSPFSDETIKMLMNMFDVDRTATIGFQEFEGLWRYIKEWQGVFRTFDHVSICLVIAWNDTG